MSESHCRLGCAVHHPCDCGRRLSSRTETSVMYWQIPANRLDSRRDPNTSYIIFVKNLDSNWRLQAVTCWFFFDIRPVLKSS